MEDSQTQNQSSLNSPEPKVLSPEDAAALEKQRLLFRELHNLLEASDVFEASSILGTVSVSISKAYEDHKNKVKLSDILLEVKSEEGLTEEVKKIVQKSSEILQLLGESNIDEALTHLEKLDNAINYHKWEREKEWKVGELGIKLL